jgi:succinoglycan biosynthesis transport protein ExoP
VEPVLEVRRGLVLAAVRRYLRLVVLGTVLGLGAGVAASQVLGGSFSSQATILLNAQEGNPYSPTAGTSRTDQLAALETEASILRTPSVADLASARTELGAAPLSRVSTSVPTNTQVIVITFSSERQAEAIAGAQAFADAYLEYRATRATSANEAEVDRLQAQLDTAQAAFDQIVADLGAAEEGVDRTLLQQQSQVYAGQIAQLKGQIAQAGSEAPSPGTVITPAAEASSDGLPTWAVVAAGGAAGLGLGVLLAIGLLVRDDRVHVDRRREVPGLGPMLATVAGDVGDTDLRNAVQAIPGTAGYQSVLATIRAQLPQDGGTVAVVGAGASVDVSAVAAGLASTSHRAGLRVLLVTLDDGDGSGVASWPHPSHHVTGRGSAAPDVAQLDPAVGLLHVLGGGTPDEVADVLASEAGHRFVQDAADTHDLVILASGAITDPVAQHSSSLARCSVVVAQVDSTTWTEMGHAAELLGQVGADPVGYVLTRPRRNPPVPAPLHHKHVAAAPAAAPSPAPAPGTSSGGAAEPAPGPAPVVGRGEPARSGTSDS